MNYFYKQTAADNTYDYFYVSTTTTANTPVSGTIPGAAYSIKYTNTASTFSNFTAMPQINLTSLAGTTVRVVFSISSDGVTPHVSPAIDGVSLVYTLGAACSGTPTPGNTLTSNATPCPSTSINLSLQNATSGSGVTYQWYNNAGLISGATSATYSPVVIAVDSYYCAVTCSGNTTNSTPVAVTLNSITNCYCTPSSTSTATYISNFSTTLGTTNISNLTSGYTTGGYQNNYATQTVTSYATSSFNYNFTVVGGTLGAAIWIDWNLNGVFDDATEKVFVTTGYSSGPYSGTINVPSGTAIGDYRMRVMVDYSSSVPTNPCMTANTRTETEDYKITVSAPPSCLAPTALATTSITETSVDASWTATTSMPLVGYEYAVTTSATPPASGTFISGTTVTASSLTPATGYYLHVRSECVTGSDYSGWATSSMFTTACEVPNNPGAISVTNPSATGFTLNYAAASPAPTSYILFYTTGTVATSTPSLVTGTSYINATDYTFSGNTYKCITNNSISPQVLSGGISNTQFNYFLYSKSTTNSCFGSPYYSSGVMVSTTTCPAAPTTAVNSAISTTGATVSWTASAVGGGAGAINYTLEVYTDSGYITAISGSPFSMGTLVTQALTGLNPSTQYFYRIKANNGSCDSTYLTGSFTTACTAFTVPYSENFDTTATGTTTVPSAPTCWSYLETAAGAGYGYTYAFGTPNTAPNHFYLYNSSDAAGSYMLVSPNTTNLSNGLNRVRFYAKGTTGYTLQVGTLSNPLDVATFTSIQTVNLTATYAEYTVDIPSGTDVNLSFKHGLGGTYRTIYIDDVTVELIPSCLPATALTATNVTATSVDLSWTASTSTPTNGYDYYYSTTNTAPTTATGSVGAGIVTKNITGLTSSTTYYYWVRAHCIGSDYSTWTSGGSFKTTPDYCAGDHFYDTGGSSSDYSIYENVTTVITPTAGNLATVTFSSFNTESGYDYLKVFDGPNASAPALHTGSGFNGDLTAGLPGPFASTHPSGTLTFVFTSDSGGNRAGWDATVTCTPLPTCLVPTALNITNLTATSVDLNWTASTSAPTNGYDYYYSTTNVAPTTTATGSVGAGIVTKNITGLTSSTTYYYWVRSHCSGADYSTWASGGSFTTRLVTASPWSEPFTTTTTPTGWVNGFDGIGSTRGVTGNPGNNIYKNLYSFATTANFTTINVGPIAVTDVLSFDFKTANFSSPYAAPAAASGNYIVAISTDYGVTFTNIETVSNDGIDGWKSKNYPLTAYAGMNVKIKITGNWTSGDYDLAFDNISIKTPPNTWTGTTDTDWSTATNWSTGVVPDGSKDVSIPSTTNKPVLATAFTIPTGKTLTISGTGTLTVSPAGSLTVAGTADFGGKLVTLKSDATGTASIGQVTGTLSNATNVVVERYIPSKRAYRFIGTPLTGTTANTIAANWQVAGEGVLLFSPATYLSQTMTGYTTGGDRPNIFKYGTAWQSIPNVATETLFGATATDANAYQVFVTGASDSGNLMSGSSATTLKPKGTLITGTVTHSLVASTYKLLANPYASALDTEALITANAGSKAWLLDPSVGYGAYVTYDGANWSTPTPAGSDKNIQSGQGFFVKSTAAMSFNFSESNKVSGSSNNWFEKSASTTSDDKIRVLLHKQEGADYVLADAILAVNSANGNTMVDGADADKISNFSDNIMFRNGTSNLSIEYRALPLVNETQPIRLTGTSANNYQLRLYVENYSNSSLVPMLEDTQAGTFTSIPTDGSTVIIPFNGVVSTSTNPDNRFRIVYQSALSNNTFSGLQVSVYPNPVNGGNLNINLSESGIASYSMYNVIGQQVAQGKLSEQSNKVNVSQLQAGVYVLNIEQSGKKQTVKIIIE